MLVIVPRIPPMSPPAPPPLSSCRADWRSPLVGSERPQVERGVVTTSLQSLRSVDRSEVMKLTCMLNTPLEFVVAVLTTLLPHCSCTPASANKTVF